MTPYDNCKYMYCVISVSTAHTNIVWQRRAHGDKMAYYRRRRFYGGYRRRGYGYRRRRFY